MEHSDYYVYVLFGWDGVPYYVGKGRRRRLNNHPDVPKAKIREGLTNAEALKIERLLIFALGRRPDGLLINKNYGGTGTLDWTIEQREAMRKRMLGRRHALGNRHTPEVIELIGAASLGRSYPNRKKIKWSRPMSDQQRAAMSKREKGRKRPAEVVAKIKAGLTGRPVSKATREKISIANTGKVHSEATIAKLQKVSGAHTRGKSWITNGVLERRIKPSDLMPDGWQIGRAARPSSDTMRLVAAARWGKRSTDRSDTED
jgi:hypothetical protein